MKVEAKPRRDPTTGCTHIKNWEHPAFGVRRCCAYCDTPQPKDIQEDLLNYCWNCGERFDHTDDDNRIIDILKRQPIKQEEQLPGQISMFEA